MEMEAHGVGETGYGDHSEQDIDFEMDKAAIEEIMWADDDEFEKSVQYLDTRGLLDLVKALQSCMIEEQQRFDELKLQLQKHSDPGSPTHKKTSAALCTSQMLLAKLCTRNMKCFTQQAVRAKQWMGTRSAVADDEKFINDQPIVKIHKMASTSIQNGCDRSNDGFKEHLRFFQSQVDSSFNCMPPINSIKIRDRSENGVQGKVNYRPASTIPSVDNILNSVKNICANQNGNAAVRLPVVSTDSNISNELEDKFHSRVSPKVSQVSEMGRSRQVSGTTRSDQVSVLTKKLTVCDSSKGQSLLSNFNPTYDVDEQDKMEEISKPKVTDYRSHLHSTFGKNEEAVSTRHEVFNFHKSSTDKLENGVHNTVLSSSKISQNSYLTSSASRSQNVKNISNVKNARNVLTTNDMHSNSEKSNNPVSNRTFGQCKDKLLSNGSTRSVFVDEIKSNKAELLNDSSLKENRNLKADDDNAAEKQSFPFETDYDTQDFVVHKTSFSDDYLETMSEDAYSSVNEEYEVEHPEDQPEGPDIPSPDYNSEEDEEYRIQHGDESQYEDAEFVDNSAQYLNDPRRYVYYPEEKELEVIPEEDEDDIEDDNIYSHEEPYTKGEFHIPTHGSDDQRYGNQGECDSGLTDDQRSSSSTVEECDLEDDTDSAKGSLPLPDSSSESPTNMDFQPKSKSRRKIVNDIDKSKINGRSVETICNGVLLEEEIEKRLSKSWTSSWDPQELLKVLYRMDFPIESLQKQKTRYINKEGYVEKLPSGRKKATYWNPWKMKYIKLKDGFLHCFDNNHTDKMTMTLQLMGGRIDSLDGKMLGIDDQKGHYVVIRCSTVEDTESWENALLSHCAEDFVNAYTSPCLYPLAISKNIIVIDLGSCSVRAGILMSSPTLPQLFFPAACAASKTSQHNVFGAEALRPNVRKNSRLSFPLHPSAKVTKYSVDVSILPELLKHIFCELNVRPENFKIQLSMPRNLSLQTKVKIARLLLDDFKVKGVNLTHQAILSLHAYNSKSGIIVDIGDRLDVIPIIEGYIVESGVTKLPYGGQRMVHHLKHALAEKNISVVSDVESYLARYTLEQLCYVAEEYNEELQRFHTNPDDFEMSISTSHFFNADCPWDEVILDLARFHVPEGLFAPETWGLDNPGLHQLVHHAIQECGVDLRREMCRSIYVSGGVTLLPGFVERLETEVDKLTPNTISPKVHASPYRYHMSYIGACQIALSDKFDDICLTKQIWKKEGNTCVKKWHI